jgi:hypothetical protein
MPPRKNFLCLFGDNLLSLLRGALPGFGSVIHHGVVVVALSLALLLFILLAAALGLEVLRPVVRDIIDGLGGGACGVFGAAHLGVFVGHGDLLLGLEFLLLGAVGLGVILSLIGLGLIWGEFRRSRLLRVPRVKKVRKNSQILQSNKKAHTT